MKKRILSLLLCMSMGIALLSGCGKEADSKAETTDTPKATQEATNDATIATTDINNQEQTEPDIFDSVYTTLKGFWVNEDMCYYFKDDTRDGKVTHYYTTTQEPDNWYSYIITADDFMGFTGGEEQYYCSKVSITATDKNGNSKEITFDTMLNDYTSEVVADVVDGDNVFKIGHVSPYSLDFSCAYEYLKFIDLKVDENGNVTLTPVDVTNSTLMTETYKDNDNAVYFCTEDSDGYYAFVNDFRNFYYDGYYVEDGFRDAEAYRNTYADWTYEKTGNPYFILGEEAFEPIPYSEDILKGYTYRVAEDKSLTYNGIDGMFLYSYAYPDGIANTSIKMEFNSVEEDNPITLKFEDEKFYQSVLTGDGFYLKGLIETDDYVVAYDDTSQLKDVNIVFNRDGVIFRFTSTEDNALEQYESLAAEYQVIVDAFSVPNGEPSLDQYIRENLPFAGYSFSEDVTFDAVCRDKESSCGLAYVKSGNLTYELNSSLTNHSDSVIATEVMIYETEFDEDFEIYALVNKTTHEYTDLYAHGYMDANKYIHIKLVPGGFFEYNKAFSEIEEESQRYIMGILRRSLATQ